MQTADACQVWDSQTLEPARKLLGNNESTHVKFLTDMRIKLQPTGKKLSHIKIRGVSVSRTVAFLSKEISVLVTPSLEWSSLKIFST